MPEIIFVIHLFDLSSAHQIFSLTLSICITSLIHPLKPLLSFSPLLVFDVPLFLQASRDEGYEVDEDLAEQDATSLFEVRFKDKICAA